MTDEQNKAAPDEQNDTASDQTAKPFPVYTSRDARRDFAALGDALSTGFPELDRQDFRFMPGKLYAVAARQSNGKTAFLLELLMRHIEQRSEDDGRGPVVFINYEERLGDIYARLLLAQMARQADVVPSWWRNYDGGGRGAVMRWLRGGAEPHEELARAADTLDELLETGQLLLVDGDLDDLGNIDTLLRRLANTALEYYGAAPSLVVVDYFQKIRPPRGFEGQSRQIQLQEVADRLRRYAKGELFGDLGTKHAVPVVVAAQLNREAARYSDDGDKHKAPKLEHIREADDLANDAAGVLTLYRAPDSERLHVRVAKNRDGKRDAELVLGFEGESGRVLDTEPVDLSGLVI